MQVFPDNCEIRQNLSLSTGDRHTGTRCDLKQLPALHDISTYVLGALEPFKNTLRL